jgi:hypothetical protein
MHLRQMAVDHVRTLVRRLRLLPRSPDLPKAAAVGVGDDRRGAIESRFSAQTRDRCGWWIVAPHRLLLIGEEGSGTTLVAHTAHWLWKIRFAPEDAGRHQEEAPPRDDDDNNHPALTEAMLRDSIHHSLTRSPSVTTMLTDACKEMDEKVVPSCARSRHTVGRIHRDVASIYGEVTQQNRNHIQHHLSNLNTLLQHAYQHDRRY